MKSKSPWLIAALLVASSAVAQDDLAKLSDEFDNEQSAGQWQRVDQVEGWNANQLELFDINKIYKGQAALMPYTSTWYKDWRGVLLFKPVKGDFVLTTRVKVTGRDGKSAPRSNYSLAGLMARAPRSITPETWQPGGENYVFVSLGAANQPGNYQFEIKTTINSDSRLHMIPANTNDAQLQIARLGQTIVLLVKTPQDPWRILVRFPRPDFPQELQCGLCTYTDFNTASRTQPRQHNGMVIREGNPDVGALYDYVRFRRPAIPAALQGRNFANPQEVSDADLLRFLGDGAMGEVGGAAPAPAAPGFATGAAQ